MHGLLLKDWYQARKYCRSLLLIAVVFSAVSVFPNNTMMAVYPLMLGALLPVTLHAYDERSGFLRYACAMPTSRRDVVAVRYVELLVALALGFAMLGAARTVGALCGLRSAVSADALLVMALFSADIAAILLPLMFRFGTERARMMIFITVGLLAALLLLTGNGLSDALGSMQALARCAVLAAALAVLPLSFLLSLRIYRRKAL